MADYDVTNLKAAANLLAEMKVSTKGIANDQERSNDLERELIAINKEMLDTKGKIKGEFKAFVSIVDDANLKIKAQVDLYEDEYDLAKSQLKITQASYKKLVESKDVTEKQKEAGNQYFQTQIDQFKVLVKEQKLRSDLKAKADGMLDGLESQVKKIPIVGDMLASTLDFGGLKKEMGGILSGITANFTMLKAGGMGTGKAIGKSFMKAIPQVAAFGATLWAAISPLLPIILPIIAALYLIKKAFDFNQKAFDLARDLGISNTEARELSQSFDKMSASSNDLSITSTALLGAQKELTKEFGRSAKFSEQMLTDQIKLTKYGGLSAEEAAKFAKASAASGMETRELQKEIIGMTKSYNDLTGDSINFKEVNKEIINLTRQQRSQFKGNHKEMIATVIEAKALGTTIEDINKAAEATLDIESSLKNEAKARMLTGVSINNNEIRAAQLSGNTAKVLELQKKQLMDIGDIENMSRFQQDSIAAAMGKSTDEILKQREIMMLLDKLNVKSLDQASRQQLIDTGITGEKADQLLKEAELQSAKEKSAAAMEKLSDQAAAMLGPIMDMIDPFLNFIDVIMPLLSASIKFAFAPLVFAFDMIEAIIGLVKGVIMLFTDFDAGILLIEKSLIDALYTPIVAIADMVDSIVAGFGGLFGLESFSLFGDAARGEQEGLQVGADDRAAKLPLKDGKTVAQRAAEGPKSSAESINDGIVKPDGTVVKTHPSDFIMAMKNPMEMFDGIGDKVGGLMSSVTSGLGGGSTEIDYEKLAAAMSTRPIVLNIDGKSVSAISKVQTKQASFRK